MKVFEGREVTLTIEDLSSLIRNGYLEEGEVKVALESSFLIIRDKDVRPSGTGSFHAYIPVPVGRKYKTIHIVPGSKK
jgi:hypothetical protein